MRGEQQRRVHMLTVPAGDAGRTLASAREAFEARVLYYLDQGVWPITSPHTQSPAILPDDRVLLVTVSDEATELVGSARAAEAPVPLTEQQGDELRVYLQAQGPLDDRQIAAWGLRLAELDVWEKTRDASPILARAGVSGRDAALRGVVTASADVYEQVVSPETAVAMSAGRTSDVMDLVRRHWTSIEFERPLVPIGTEGEAADVQLPPGLERALVCRDAESANLVVVTVADPGAGVDVVGQTLRHIGWLRQYAGPQGRSATGLIIAEEPTDDLVYAASAAPNLELTALQLRLMPMSPPPVDPTRAEQRFWRAIEELSAWCAVHSLEATLRGRETDFDPVDEASPVWEFVATLAASVDHRCPWTAGHSTRVAALLEAMADQLRLGGDVRKYLRIAGLLHDVGNMGVPIQLLDKRTRLSGDELSTIKRHPELGARIVREMNLLSPVAAGIYHHHERLDGRGYPSGLDGDQIPLMARMIGVACCFDAMTSRRPYREAISPEMALETMQADAGSHWDTSIVRALARIVG